MADKPASTIAQAVAQPVGYISLMDGFLIGASKMTTEYVFASVPYLRDWVGNSTYKSGLIKLLLAIGLSMVTTNKYVRIVQTGMLVDGVEDILVNARAQFMNRGSNSTDLSAAPFAVAFA